MTNYAAEADKATKKFSKNPEDAHKGIAAVADVAQTFIKDAKEHAGEFACETTKHLKDAGQKNLHKVEDFVKEHPAKGALFAVGIGAAIALLLMPRK